MKGYVVHRRNRYYTVIYEGLDPVTGRERRSWHPAGTDRGDAKRLAARLAAQRTGGRRRGPLPELRCVPHTPVASGQEERT